MNGRVLAFASVAGLVATSALARRGSLSHPSLRSRTNVVLPPGWTIVLNEESEFALLDAVGTWRGNVILAWSTDGGSTFPIDWRCQENLEALSRRTGRNLGALFVEYSRVDDDLHGKGYGLLLYEQALQWAADEGYAVAPASCDGSSTSSAAQRTWERLKRLYPHEGSVVWGGELPGGVASLAAVGLAASHARPRAAGSHDRSLGGIFVLPDLERAWNAWTRHRVDTPIAWHEGDALVRDAYRMSDLLSDCADAVGWDSLDDNARAATGGFWRNEVNGEAKARNEVHGELRAIASTLGTFSFPLTVYRGTNILAPGDARRQMARFLAERQAAGDHGHWTTDIRVARHFANGTHDASEIHGGVPHLYRGTIISASDVRWRSTISALFGYGMDDDPVHSEFEIYARKIQGIQEIP